MKSKLMKRFLSVFLIALMTVLLFGCSSDEVELKTVSMFGGTDPHVETYEALLASFEKENDVKIVDNSATSDEIWKTSVLSSFYTGVEPDVLFYFTGATAKPLVTNGYVVSVADIRKEYPNYAKNVSESVMDPYAVPLKGFVEGIFVNTELFTGDLASYLEKDVWTWDDFHAIAQKLIAKDIIPFAFGATDVPHYWIEHTVLSVVGPTAFTDIKTSITEKENDWVKALKLINHFAETGWYGPTKGNQEHASAETLFKDAKAAMILDGSWFAGNFNETTKVKASKMKMMPFPAVPTTQGGKNEVYMQSGFTSGFYITKKAWNDPEKRELAVKLVEKMTSTNAITEFCKTGGVPSDPKVTISNQSNLQISMNSMPARTKNATLPLSDAAKAQTFATLVEASNAYITGNDAEIRAALKAFANKQ